MSRFVLNASFQLIVTTNEINLLKNVSKIKERKKRIPLNFISINSDI